MSDIVERLEAQALPDANDEREVMHAPLLREAADAIEARDAEIERLRAEYEDEIDLKRAALNGTSKLMGAEIERLRALLREALENIDSEACNEDLCKRIRAALGDEP